ncbi:hypothetical protein K8I85_15065, partial [bacterium]|nr:hypothetical protein [bacterium]
EGNGIVFDHATTDGVRWALRAALDLYRDEALWSRLRVRGMAEDFSWDRRGPEYLAVYDSLLSPARTEV